jgi:hypothetical protein
MTTEEIKSLDKHYEAIGWSLWFIWIGVSSIISGLPDGTGTLGTALLLLGLNVARYRHTIPVSNFSLFLGMLALVDGTVDLLRDVLALHIELEFFPVLLMIVGVIMMVRALDPQRSDEIEKPKRGIEDILSIDTDSTIGPALADNDRREMMQSA